MGASRDLTQLFYQKKQQVMNGGIDYQRERFKPKSNILQNPLTKSGELQQHLQNEANNAYGFGSAPAQSQSLNTSNQTKYHQNNQYEEQVQQNLPPVWIDLQDDVDDNLI